MNESLFANIYTVSHSPKLGVIVTADNGSTLEVRELGTQTRRTLDRAKFLAIVATGRMVRFL